VGLLLLNCLLALADYIPYARWRMAKTVPPIAQKHPLARRVEQAVPLTEAPDLLLERASSLLQQAGFRLYEPDPQTPEMIGAVRGRWGWPGISLVYVGLLLIIIALVISHYFFATDRLLLAPLKPRSSHLLEGKLELTAVEANLCQVTYRHGEPEQKFTWLLYRPVFLGNTLLLPYALEPLLTVEVRDATNTPLQLIPLQTNLPPAERLHFPLDGANAPFYFRSPAADLTFQLFLPHPTAPNIYNLQLLRGSETSLAENIEGQVGQPITLEENGPLSVLVSRSHQAKIWTYYDPAGPLYLLGGMLTIGGVLLLWWCSPLQVWLIPGGQLYVVAETIAPSAQLLDELLTSLNRDLLSVADDV
jgi:hypothetical protein